MMTISYSFQMPSNTICVLRLTLILDEYYSLPFHRISFIWFILVYGRWLLHDSHN